MITALNIEDYSREGIAALLNLFRHNRIRARHMYCDTAAVKSLCYERYRGKVSWAAIDRFVGSQRRQVLCAETLELPPESGLKRFESPALSRRMCENAAVALLRSTDRRDIRVALVDSSGESAQLCESLSDFADPLYVVTDAADVYIAQAEYLLSEKGAALRVSRSSGCLRYADLIIAPARIQSDLDCSSDAVILSGELPDVRQNAPVVYEYFFELPKKYQDIKPPYLDDMYFASALYALAGARELGSELFTRCGDGSIIHTRMSLTETLTSRCEKQGQTHNDTHDQS